MENHDKNHLEIKDDPHFKRCFKCQKEKPIHDFYAHAAMKDGHLNKCKECAKRDVYEHRHGKNRDKVLEYDRVRAKNPNRMQKAKEIAIRWRQDYPERRAAHIKLRSALRSGKVQKWPVCAMPDCTRTPEAHHPTYSLPLAVVWLCPAHHKQAHALKEQS